MRRRLRRRAPHNGFPFTVHFLAETLLLLGDGERAAELLVLAEGMTGQLLVQPGPTLFLGPADLPLAVLAHTAGDADRARHHLAAAHDVAAAFDAPFWVERVRQRAQELVGG